MFYYTIYLINVHFNRIHFCSAQVYMGIHIYIDQPVTTSTTHINISRGHREIMDHKNNDT